MRDSLVARALVALAATVSVLAACVGSAGAATQARTIMVAPPGVEPNGPSGSPSISANDEFVAFSSVASNLGPVVGNYRTSHIYLFDVATGKVALVSQALNGGEGNGPATNPSVSADGSVVAFTSSATNLAAGTPQPINDVFVKTATGPVRLISVGFGGGQADSASSQPVISANGRYVAFASVADNIVPGDSNSASDIFLADLETGTIRRISVSSAGRQANGPSYNPSISADGNLISFTSEATNLVPGDHNHVADVFVHNMTTGTTRRVSSSSYGREQNAAVPAPFTEYSDVSGDGHYVVFDSNATNLVRGVKSGHTNVYRHSLVSGHTWLVSESSRLRPGDNDSFAPATSADGNVTVFESFADNLASPWVPNENIFAQQFATHTTLDLDVTPSGGPRGPELDAQLLQQPAVSADGSLVAFVSGANNLVPGTNNGTDNLYLRDIATPAAKAVRALAALRACTGSPC